MTLAEMQAAFMAQVLDDEVQAPADWGKRHARGMEVYRNNYRSSLVEALLETYQRTARWVGEDAFRRAAAHHLIANPPSSWTIDEAGRGFDRTCAELFANDPEVEELAWLEWAMFDKFSAPDSVPLDAAGFAKATAGFVEDDWGAMCLTVQPGSVARELNHDLSAIWNSPEGKGQHRATITLDQAAGCLVWREGERPTFLMVDAEETRAFQAMASGMSYGECCMMLAGQEPSPEQARDAAMRAGAMLGRWLNEGLVAALRA